jgi:4-amino-4-deoxy-L-arabinose transferase-like glycosyltransferase
MVLASGAFLRFWQLGALGFNSDEVVYAGQAASLAGNPVYRDDFPVFRAHPMLVQSLLSPFFRSGEHDVVGRVVMALVGLATVGLVYVLGRVLYASHATGLLAAAVMALMPYHVVVSRQVLLDGPVVFCATIVLVCLVRYAQTERASWLVAGGGAMGLTMLAKESSVVLLGGVYAFLALSPQIRGQLKAIMLAGPLVVAMFLVHPLSMSLAGHSSTGKSYLIWQLMRRPNHGFAFYAETVPWALGPLVVLAAVAAVLFKLTDRSWREVLLVCWIAAPVVAFTLWPVKGFQYLLPIAPAVALLAARGLLGTVRLRYLYARLPVRHARHVRTVAVAVVLTSLCFASFGRIAAPSGSTFLAGSGGVPGGKEAGLWMASHTPRGAQVLTLGPSMANIIKYYGHRESFGLSVSPNPLHRNPSYPPVVNPDFELRDGALQYVVWDSFSAGRSPHFSSKLQELIRRYHGHAVHTEYVQVESREGSPGRVPVVVVYEVRP